MRQSHLPVRALIVGAGNMSKWHVHALRRCQGMLVGVVDVSLSKAQALAVETGTQHFTTVDDALKAIAPDIVHVCTPSGAHADACRQALEAGCHVLVEKPLTDNSITTTELLTVARKADRMLVPVHQFPFQDGVRDIVRRQTELGAILSVEVQMATAGAMSNGMNVDTLVVEILPHCLSLTQCLLNESLLPIQWHVLRSQPGEWRITGTHNATSIAFMLSSATRPTFAEMRVFGSKATAFADLFHGFAVIDAGAVTRTSKAVRPLRVAARSFTTASANLARRGIRGETAYPGLNELVRQMYGAIRGVNAIPIGPGEVADVAQVRDVLIALSERP